jgi:hypothetical protein
MASNIEEMMDRIAEWTSLEGCSVGEGWVIEKGFLPLSRIYPPGAFFSTGAGE